MRTLRLAHSPDPDDAFMFHALAAGRIPTGDLRFDHVLADIETLNRKATEGAYEVTALSFHGYAYVQDRYVLCNCGASFGDGYGPILVAREAMDTEDLLRKPVAIPGLWTSAWLALQLWRPGCTPRVMEFDRIPAAVASGEVDSGLLIHEGQLTYADDGLRAVVDLGAWWKEETGLPLPLGANAIRRDLGADLCRGVDVLLAESIRHGLAHRREALDHAMAYGRNLDRDRTDRFVGMYVNRWTEGYGPEGRRAIDLFFSRAHAAGILPERVVPEFVG